MNINRDAHYDGKLTQNTHIRLNSLQVVCVSYIDTTTHKQSDSITTSTHHHHVTAGNCQFYVQLQENILMAVCTL